MMIQARLTEYHGDQLHIDIVQDGWELTVHVYLLIGIFAFFIIYPLTSFI